MNIVLVKDDCSMENLCRCELSWSKLIAKVDGITDYLHRSGIVVCPILLLQLFKIAVVTMIRILCGTDSRSMWVELCATFAHCMQGELANFERIGRSLCEDIPKVSRYICRCSSLVGRTLL
jgi:hypothetical protein